MALLKNHGEELARYVHSHKDGNKTIVVLMSDGHVLKKQTVYEMLEGKKYDFGKGYKLWKRTLPNVNLYKFANKLEKLLKVKRTQIYVNPRGK